MPQGRVESIDKETKKAVISGKEVQLGKKLFNPALPFEVGDTIVFEMKGANFEYKTNLGNVASGGKGGNNNQNRNQAQNNNSRGGSTQSIGNFSYPYNFVSLGAPGAIKREKYSKGTLSGIIHCELTTRTPLMIGGERKDNGRGHFMEEFYKENGKFLIPGSSLKGAIRNVFDAVTNSCMHNVQDEQLEKRVSAGGFNNRKFGIIKELPTKEKDGIIVEAEVIKIKNGRNGSALPMNMRNEGIYTERFKESIFNLAANPQDTRNAKVIESEKEYNDLVDKKNGRIGVVWASSKIFNKNNDKILIARANAKEYKFTLDDYEDFKYLLVQRAEREAKENKSFYYEKELRKHENDLKPWYDPIIFNPNSDGTTYLTFSEIPRLRYKYSPADLVPKEYHSCSTIDNLCPSCNLFGMVETDGRNEDKDRLTNSLSGRVSISDGELVGNAKEIKNKLIKSLGEPHPTLTGFYLTNPSGYDDKSGSIRGRKFYWHHSDKIGKDFDSFYKSIMATKQEKHNSTISCLDKDNKFTFKVTFNNLKEEELQSLVYAIALEEGMLHKFGKAKAFGFGSSKVEIKALKLDKKGVTSNNFTKAYETLNVNEYIEAVKKRTTYSSTSMKELVRMMSEKTPMQINFKESPFPEDSNKKGEINTLNWFMNKKSECTRAKTVFTLPKVLDYK